MKTLLQNEVFRADLEELESKIKPGDITQQFINLIPEAMKLAHHDRDRKIMLTATALIKYYGPRSEIGINITEEIATSIEYIEDHNEEIDLRELSIYLYIHCNDPHFLFPLWFVHS
jgi:hypothetical protein